MDNYIENKWKLIPNDGVYAVIVEYKYEKFPAMMNIGYNPTYNAQQKTLAFSGVNEQISFHDCKYHSLLCHSKITQLHKNACFHFHHHLLHTQFDYQLTM